MRIPDPKYVAKLRARVHLYMRDDVAASIGLNDVGWLKCFAGGSLSLPADKLEILANHMKQEQNP